MINRKRKAKEMDDNNNRDNYIGKTYSVIDNNGDEHHFNVINAFRSRENNNNNDNDNNDNQNNHEYDVEICVPPAPKRRRLNQ